MGPSPVVNDSFALHPHGKTIKFIPFSLLGDRASWGSVELDVMFKKSRDKDMRKEEGGVLKCVLVLGTGRPHLEKGSLQLIIHFYRSFHTYLFCVLQCGDILVEVRGGGLEDSVFSFYHVGVRDQTSGLRAWLTRPEPLSHHIKLINWDSQEHCCLSVVITILLTYSGMRVYAHVLMGI